MSSTECICHLLLCFSPLLNRALQTIHVCHLPNTFKGFPIHYLNMSPNQSVSYAGQVVLTILSWLSMWGQTKIKRDTSERVVQFRHTCDSLERAQHAMQRRSGEHQGWSWSREREGGELWASTLILVPTRRKEQGRANRLKVG